MFVYFYVNKLLLAAARSSLFTRYFKTVVPNLGTCPPRKGSQPEGYRASREGYIGRTKKCLIFLKNTLERSKIVILNNRVLAIFFLSFVFRKIDSVKMIFVFYKTGTN